MKLYLGNQEFDDTDPRVRKVTYAEYTAHIHFLNPVQTAVVWICIGLLKISLISDVARVLLDHLATLKEYRAFPKDRLWYSFQSLPEAHNPNVADPPADHST